MFNRALPLNEFADDKLLQLELLFNDLVQVSRAVFFVIRFGVCNFELMQLLATASNGRACWSLGIGRLRWLRDESPHQFSSCADYVNFHSYNQSCKFRLCATDCVPGLWISTV
jgi:hypothetical protein